MNINPNLIRTDQVQKKQLQEKTYYPVLAGITVFRSLPVDLFCLGREKAVLLRKASHQKFKKFFLNFF